MSGVLNGLRVWGLMLAGAVALAGCSGGTDEAPAQLQLSRAAKGVFGRVLQGQKTRSGQVEISRAQLEAIGVPITGISAERRGLSAYFFLVETRRDETPGQIEVWMSGDQLSTVSTRGGAVIATRGLGGDVLSSGVPLADGAPASGALEQRIFIGDNSERGLTLRCETEDLGPETVEILGVSHATRHLRQICEGAGGRVSNDFWRAPGDGTVWQSRQWAGPHVGYLQLRRVTK